MIASILEKMLEPAISEMPPAYARKVLQLRADGDILARIEELRSKANQGTLTQEEDHEYKDIVEAIDIISMLQQQARRLLGNQANGN